MRVARGRGRDLAMAAMMASRSSSESTAPWGSRSSASGALASMAAPVVGLAMFCEEIHAEWKIQSMAGKGWWGGKEVMRGGKEEREKGIPD